MAESKSEYWLESEEEVARLSNQHAVIKDAMGGSLVRAPIDENGLGLRILDSGTADGTWNLDFNETTHSKHQFIGTDIQDKDFPKSARSNITFHTQDVNADWPAEYTTSIDLVHQRLVMVGAGPNWETALSRLTAMVKPGGWIQLIEAENTFPATKTERPAGYDFVKPMTGLFEIMGLPLTLADDMTGWLGRNGFRDVQGERVDIPLGRSNTREELVRRSVYSNVVAVKELVAFAKTLPGPPLPKERLEALVPDFEEELKR